MADPVYALTAEFVTGSFTDITGDVVQISVVRQLSDLFTDLTPGEMTVQFSDHDMNYAPDNSASAYAGLVQPAIAVKLEATHSGSTYRLFAGRVDEWRPRPGIEGQRRTLMRARDEIKGLRNRTLTTSVFTNFNVGSLFVEVFSKTEVASYAIDALTDVSPFTWFRDETGAEAVQRLLRSGFFFGYVDGGGQTKIRDRYFDQEQPVVASYDELLEYSYTLNDDDVYNDISIEGIPRQASATSTLAWIIEPVLIAGSSWVSFELEYLDPETGEPSPGNAMVAPVNSTDYTTDTQSGGGGTDRTATTSAATEFFGQTAVNTVFNGHGDTVYLNKFQVRGASLQRRARFLQKVDDSSSDAIYGRRSFALTNEFLQSHLVAEDYAAFLIDRHKNPAPKLQIGVKNTWPDQLAWELGDLVHVVNTLTGVASQHTITEIEHAIMIERGLEHTTIYRLGRFRDQNALILDSTDFGKLDDGRKLAF